jgi:hypothetical protein
MFMLIGVFVAFFGTRSACSCAGLHRRRDNLFVAPGSTNTYGARSQAEVGAVLIQANALAKLVHHIFCQTGICAGDAGLGARVAFLEAADQSLIGVALNLRMGGNHLLHVMHDGHSPTE